MTALAVFLLAFAAGAVVEYYADLWSIRYNNGVKPPYPFGHKAMAARVLRARFYGSGLRLLGRFDVVAAGVGFLGGVRYAVIVYVGEACGEQAGGWIATGKEMWRKFHKRAADLAAAKEPNEEDDD